MTRWYTIGQLAGACGIARSTLLYYEQAGLLAPAARSAAGYRRYTDAQAQRLRQICDYRAAGLGVAAIGALLGGGERSAVIGARLRDIAAEMAQLRQQQAVLLRLLGGQADMHAPMDKQEWSALFRSSGMDEAAMMRWHALFERQNPAAHAAFLASLGIDAEEGARIRDAARAMDV